MLQAIKIVREAQQQGLTTLREQAASGSTAGEFAFGHGEDGFCPHRPKALKFNLALVPPAACSVCHLHSGSAQPVDRSQDMVSAHLKGLAPKVDASRFDIRPGI